MHGACDSATVHQENVEQSIMVVVQQRYPAWHGLNQVFLRRWRISQSEIEPGRGSCLPEGRRGGEGRQQHHDDYLLQQYSSSSSLPFECIVGRVTQQALLSLRAGIDSSLKNNGANVTAGPDKQDGL
jgi:hypothetical protein